MTASPKRGRHEGRLRVVCWNIAHKPTAWAALDSLEPDISLLNEAVVPEGSRGVWSRAGTRGRDGAERPWTAAVMSDWPSSRDSLGVSSRDGTGSILTVRCWEVT